MYISGLRSEYHGFVSYNVLLCLLNVMETTFDGDYRIIDSE